MIPTSTVITWGNASGGTMSFTPPSKRKEPPSGPMSHAVFAGPIPSGSTPPSVSSVNVSSAPVVSGGVAWSSAVVSCATRIFFSAVTTQPWTIHTITASTNAIRLIPLNALVALIRLSTVAGFRTARCP